jgi:predicted ArsR family transcriptional regulator
VGGEAKGGETATRDRILVLLRRGPGTVDELSREVGVTPNSVRVQLATLERDGLVRREGLQRRARKPSHLYALSADAERRFSKAYVPFLASLLEVLADRIGPDATATILQEVGRRIGREHAQARSDPARRLRDALDLLGELGGAVEVERHDGAVVVRGLGCPLGEVVHEDRRVCGAMQTMLAEVIGVPVRESCERGERPACRFELDLPGEAA